MDPDYLDGEDAVTPARLAIRQCPENLPGSLSGSEDCESFLWKIISRNHGGYDGVAQRQESQLIWDCPTYLPRPDPYLAQSGNILSIPFGIVFQSQGASCQHPTTTICHSRQTHSRPVRARKPES